MPAETCALEAEEMEITALVVNGIWERPTTGDMFVLRTSASACFRIQRRVSHFQSQSIGQAERL